MPPRVEAAALSEAAIRLDRMGASVAASSTNQILVIIKPATAGTEARVKISWPDSTSSAFTVSGTAANHTVSTASLPSTFQGESLTALPSISGTASLVTDTGANTDVTFTTGDLSVGTLYGFYLTGGITNPSTPGGYTPTITTQTSGTATIDSSTAAVDITSASGDQVTVTATVPAAFNFNINSTSISLGALDASSIKTGNTTIDVDTNANNGWAAWMRSEGGAAVLASASTGDTIASTGTVNAATETVVAGTENYVVDVNVAAGTNSTGSRTIATEYDGNGTTQGGTLGTAYQEILYSTGQADSDTITLTAIVAISGVTKAATDYTDTWEVVGAANF
jgi:hypothetical protein